MRESASKVSKLAGGHRLALCIQRHHLHLDAGVVELADAAQPVDLDPLLLGLVSLEGVGRHMIPVAAVDDHRLLHSEAAGGAGRIHGGVAATIDGYPAPQFGKRQPLLFGQARLLEKAHRIEDLARLPGRNIDPLGQMGTDGHKDGVKAPLVALTQYILHLVVEGQRHPGGQDAGNFPIQHVAGQSIGGNAKAQHAAGERARLADLHLMTEPVEVPGARKPGGARAYDQYLLAAGGRGGCRLPAPGQRLVTKKAFDGVNGDGFIHPGAVAGALAGVITDPAVDGRQRIFFDQGLPGRFKAPGLGQGEPGLNVFTGRAGVIAGWQGRPPNG